MNEFYKKDNSAFKISHEQFSNVTDLNQAFTELSQSIIDNIRQAMNSPRAIISGFVDDLKHFMKALIENGYEKFAFQLGALLKDLKTSAMS